jgi:hypothetical protein
MRPFLFALVAVAIGSSAQASGPCPGGQCRVAQTTKTVVRTTAKTTTRAVTAPVRVVRRVFGR